jgi:hypothetical protein
MFGFCRYRDRQDHQNSGTRGLRQTTSGAAISGDNLDDSRIFDIGCHQEDTPRAGAYSVRAVGSIAVAGLAKEGKA